MDNGYVDATGVIYNPYSGAIILLLNWWCTTVESNQVMVWLGGFFEPPRGLGPSDWIPENARESYLRDTPIRNPNPKPPGPKPPSQTIGWNLPRYTLED